jgi:plastocyanin
LSLSFHVCTGEVAKRPRVLFIVVALFCASTLPGNARIGTLDLQGIVTAGGRPAPDAVIWLDAPGDPGPSPSKPIVLDQRNLAFFPRVLVVRVGTTVELPNNDRVFHNVFSFHDGKKFDLGLYPVGTRKQVRFDKPGLSRIFCNIHQNMAAYVLAVNSPYFAVSGREGRFTIPIVPQGTYTYHAWRAGKETLTGSAVVAAEHELNIQWP